MEDEIDAQYALESPSLTSYNVESVVTPSIPPPQFVLANGQQTPPAQLSPGGTRVWM